ncbi:MAG: NAD(+)/NADH kinase [Acidobacteria bacterium]|nr:NAD(+)/NADH kinase [Acidobacteriota bacterium]
MPPPVLAVVAKVQSPNLAQTLRDSVPLFLERGWTAVGHPSLGPAWQAAGLPPGDLRRDPELGAGDPPPDLGLVLGGDGTMLWASRLLGARGTPLLSLNLGSLGFLTAQPAASARATVEAFFEGRLRREERRMLLARLVRDGRTLARQSILNDAVMTRGSLARIMDFNLWVGGQQAAMIRADGLIVATPTGSTAYSLSAGGPILHPSLAVWVISPICPHSLTLRPMVVPGELEVSISVGETDDAHLTLDGQMAMPLQHGDHLELGPAEKPLVLLRPQEMDFFGILRQKFHWSDR